MHSFDHRLSSIDQVGGCRWPLTNMESTHPFLIDLIFPCHSFVLSQVLVPRANHIGFDIALWLERVYVDAPTNCSIAQPHLMQVSNCLEKGQRLLRTNPVLD